MQKTGKDSPEIKQFFLSEEPVKPEWEEDRRRRLEDDDRRQQQFMQYLQALEKKAQLEKEATRLQILKILTWLFIGLVIFTVADIVPVTGNIYLQGWIAYR